MMTAIDLTFPAHFHFEHTVYSHGWCALFPFRVRSAPLRLDRTLLLPSGRTAELTLTAARGKRCSADIRHSGRLSVRDRAAIGTAAHDMLHLDLDLRPFYRRVREEPSFSWIARARTGRMLRAPTFFEDVVKMILTTNCSWALTTQMNARLCESFGTAGPEGYFAFPLPDAIADSSERFLRKEVKLGYRAPFVLELARRIAGGSLDIESFREADLPANDLHRALRSIKGVGEYAASNLLKLLGRYDYLGLDSWCRSKFAELYNEGAPVDDRRIERFYAPFEEWKGLVMWMDVTRHWYAEKFPL